jgi:nucleoside-diphosphate-sugar epimerase
MTADPGTNKPWILLTGASGFVGKYLRFALNHKYRFWCLDRIPVPDMYVGDTGDVVDIGSVSSLTEVWERRRDIAGQLHAVIHLAAYYDFSNRPAPEYSRINQGLERLLMLISKDSPGNCLVLHAGSVTTLVPALPGQRLNEGSPRAGTWEYTRSKLQAERLLDRSSIRQPIVQLILAGIYSDWCELVPLFRWIELCAGSGVEKHFYPGPPTRGHVYVHIDDALRAFEIVLERFGSGGDLISQAEVDLLEKRLKKSVEVSMEGGVREKFLIGQPQPLTYRELHARCCAALLGRAIPLIQLPPDWVKIGAMIMESLAKVRKQVQFIRPWMIDRAGDHYSLDLTRTRTRLGWVPKRSIQTDLDAILVRALRERQQWMKLNLARPW